ncbi:MAG: hypothetical protein HUJ31_06930, partial [Pseudomonadales bacterium]|nr:hypothetical protein [Pseudomonadales bacterium]
MTDLLSKSFRKILRISVIFGVTYVVALLGLYLFQEEMLFFPRPESPSASRDYTEFEVSFTVGENRLDGWYIPGSSEHTVVYYGGNGDEQSINLRTITEIGDFNCLMVNYRGYGESTGEPSESALKADALVVHDRASEQFDFDIDTVIVMGRSLGTCVAMHVSPN